MCIKRLWFSSCCLDLGASLISHICASFDSMKTMSEKHETIDSPRSENPFLKTICHIKVSFYDMTELIMKWDIESLSEDGLKLWYQTSIERYKIPIVKNILFSFSSCALCLGAARSRNMVIWVLAAVSSTLTTGSPHSVLHCAVWIVFNGFSRIPR